MKADGALVRRRYEARWEGEMLDRPRPEDLMGVCEAWKPELLLVDVNCASPAEADELMQSIGRRYGVRNH